MAIRPAGARRLVAAGRVAVVTRYRKRPSEVDAVRWFRNGDHPDDGPADREGRVVRFWRRPDIPGDAPCPTCRQPMRAHGWIDTLEDGHRVCPGDWIVTGPFGDRYPVKDFVFTATFEAVE